MGAAREPRPSEKTFNIIYAEMKNLTVCVWYPITEDAIEMAERMKKNLDTLIEQMKEEKGNK